MTTTAWQIIIFAFVIFEWLLRFIMLFVVPKNRQPSAANAWLLLIMIVPTLGSIIFLMFGQPKLPKARRIAQQEMDDFTLRELTILRTSNPHVTSQPLHGPHASIERLVTSLGGLPAMKGNDIQFHTDYQAILREVARLIRTARHYIHLEFFIFVLDEETEDIFAALDEAAARGVTIRVLFDRFATRYYPGYKKTIRRLNAMKAEWHPMLPYNLMPGPNFTRPDLRNHRKIVIIDGKIGMSGSANIVKKSYHRRDDLVYEDLMVTVKGPAVWQCNNVFRSDWYAETGEPLHELVDETDMPGVEGEALLQLLPSGPSHAHENNHMLYTSLFHVAQQRISIVVPYFVPDESVITAIIAAAKRGVRVTIINSEIIDKLLTGHAQRSYYEQLLGVGVEIYLYEKPIFLHTKQVIIDDEIAVVGSSNLDIRSFELDLELSMVLYGKEVVSKLARSEEAYLKRAQLVNSAKWAKRPVRLKMLDNIARLTASIQ